MIHGGWDRWRRGVSGWVVVAAALLAVAGPAGGIAAASTDHQPPILAAYNLDWIEHVPDSAWKLPPEERPVICLLDTGVAVTPDTPAENPRGPIVARLDLDGRGGEPQGTTPLHLHGTQMASIIGAPRNDWGTVGVLPQARIVSVRVTVGFDTFMTPAAVGRGLDLCLGWGRREQLAVAAVVMPQSRYDDRESEVTGWRNRVQAARLAGTAFVAAVGNGPNAAEVMPVAVDHALAISAGDPRGILCGFSPAALQRTLIGPGCDGPGRGWPAGSSAATAAVGALVAAIMMRERDGFSGDPVVEQAALDRVLTHLQDAAIAVGGGERRVDGRAVAKGLFELSRPAVGAVTPHTQDVGLVPTQIGRVRELGTGAQPRIRLERPRVTVVWKAGRLTVTRITHRRTGRMVVQVGEGKRSRRFVSLKRTVSARFHKPPRRIQMWIESKRQGDWVTLKRREAVKRR